MRQHRFSPIVKNPQSGLRVDGARVVIVAVILIAALAANVAANLRFPVLLDALPVLGLAVWAAILMTAFLRAPDWKVMPETFKARSFIWRW